MLKFSTYNDLLENEGLKKKAEKSGVSLGTLKKVYNRGMAAWKTGHRPGTTPQQWAHARVNSYITKGKGTYHGADKDLRDDVGDIMVVLINSCVRNNITLEECLQVAYDDIKDRKGKMVDGVFIKEE